MEFLDVPLVRAILMGAAFGMLVSWLFGRYLPIFNKTRNNVISLKIITMIDELSDIDLSHIRKALDDNRKIEAIKLFRAATNAGLRDSMMAVEHLVQRREKTV